MGEFPRPWCLLLGLGDDGVCLALALLGNLDLEGLDLAALDKLTEQGGSLLRGHFEVCAYIGGGGYEALLVEKLNDGGLEGLVGDGGLGGLGLAVGVALVHLVDGGGGESDGFGSELAVLYGGQEVAVSHIRTFLLHYAVDAKFFIQFGELLSLALHCTYIIAEVSEFVNTFFEIFVLYIIYDLRPG